MGKLKITYPNSLKKQFTNGTVPANLGNFGHLIYGSSNVTKYFILISV